MGFETLAARARKDPFAFALLNRTLGNQRANEALQLYEHTHDGEHNALEVARSLGTAVWDGATSYSLEGESPSGRLVGVTRVGTGEVSVEVQDCSLPLAVRLSCMADLSESVPYLLSYEVASASEIIVNIQKLSALGGNTWVAADGHFAIGVHSVKFAPLSSPVTAIANAKRGDTLGPSKVNQLFVNAAQLRARMMAEHTSAGAHNAREIAKGFARLGYTGGLHSLDDSENVSSVSNVSTGRVRLTLPGSTYTTPLQVFGQPDYDRTSGVPQDLTVVCFPRAQHTATTIDAYLYQYDSSANSWGRAEFPFAASIHTDPT